MITKPLKMSLAAGMMVVLGAASLPTALAQNSQKNQNTLRKVGNAVQYTVRKDTNNLSIDTHRALGRNSVEHRRLPHGRRRNVVITPKGQIKPAPPK